MDITPLGLAAAVCRKRSSREEFMNPEPHRLEQRSFRLRLEECVLLVLRSRWTLACVLVAHFHQDGTRSIQPLEQFDMPRRLFAVTC